VPDERKRQARIAEVNLRLGRLELHTGNYGEASGHYQEAIASARSRHEAEQIRGKIKNQIKAYCDSLPESDWEKADAALELMGEAVLQGDRQVRTWRADLWRRRGDALKEAGDTAGANQAYERAEEIAQQRKRQLVVAFQSQWVRISLSISLCLFVVGLLGVAIRDHLVNTPPTPTSTFVMSRVTPTHTPSITPSHTPTRGGTKTPTLTATPTTTPTTVVTPTATPTGTPTPTPVPLEPGLQVQWENDQSTLVYVPSANGVDAFWMDLYPVTNEQFQLYVDEIGHKTQAEELRYGWAWNPVVFQRLWGGSWKAPQGTGSTCQPDHPVVLITWQEAADYCVWAGKRLPREAEWQLAAKGTDGRQYPWGNQEPSSRYLNYCDIRCRWAETRDDDGYARTSPADAFPAGKSPYGLYDMAGNAWEWTTDWDDEHEKRIICGGSWAHPAANAGISGVGEPEVPLNVIGFRCAHDANFEITEQNESFVPNSGQ
jgi:formylglycine-generating enzyme required for sulfatase activity